MEKLSFDLALNRLETITEQLESGQLSLEEALDLFEKGVELSLFCRAELDKSEGKISRLVKKLNGDLELQDL